MKKRLAILLALAMMFSMISETVNAAGGSPPYIYRMLGHLYASPHQCGVQDNVNYFSTMFRLSNDSEKEDYGYCCDLRTSVNPESYYKRMNLEDAGYYSTEAARHIRGILKEGYRAGQTDLSELAAKSGVTNLTAAEALSATQCAIWYFSNSDMQLQKVYSRTKSAFSMKPYDPDTVDADESVGGSSQGEFIEKHKNNVESVYRYLITTKESAPSTVIYAFDGGALLLGAGNAGGYSLTGSFRMKGSPEGIDNLSLTATLINANSVLQGPVPVDMTKQENGYYSITFDGVSPENINGDTRVELNLSGTQEIKDDVYFYEPEGGRDTSQCMVGFAAGATPVSDQLILSTTGEKVSCALYKYDADVSGNEVKPLAGAEFSLYYRMGSEEPKPVPGAENIITGEDGMASFDILLAGDGVEYLVKELKAPSGYLPVKDWIPIGPGINEIGNHKFKEGSAVISGQKYLDSVPSGTAFTFTLTDMTNEQASVLVETVENDSSGNFTFSPISYQTPGTYRYLVQEKAGDGNYSYDTRTYAVLVEVTENRDGSGVSAQTPVVLQDDTVSGNDQVSGNDPGIVFKNTTKGKSGGGGDSGGGGSTPTPSNPVTQMPVQIPVIPGEVLGTERAPKTGDMGMTVIWLTLMAGSLLGISGVLRYRKKY